MVKAFTWNPKGQGVNAALDGGDDSDELHAGNGNNLLRGFGGADHLSGGNGNDTLVGGDGADTLVGGDEADAIDGGAGVDVMVYTDHWQSTDAERDTITFDGLDLFDLRLISSGAVTSFSQISFEVIDGGFSMHVDVGGDFDTNDMWMNVLGVQPVEDNFIFA